jgi:hypothetical protein
MDSDGPPEPVVQGSSPAGSALRHTDSSESGGELPSVGRPRNLAKTHCLVAEVTNQEQPL